MPPKGSDDQTASTCRKRDALSGRQGMRPEPCAPRENAWTRVARSDPETGAATANQFGAVDLAEAMPDRDRPPPSFTGWVAARAE